jgi:hypothetical protein
MIYIATPLNKEGKLNIETAQLCSYMDKRDDVSWCYIKTFSPEMSRNNLIEDIVRNKTDMTYLWFIDADVVPPMYTFTKLFDLNIDVAVGCCPIYLKEGMYWNIADEKGYFIPYHEDLPQAPFKIPSCGAGCLLIKREVLDNIEWPYFKMEYQPKWENKGSAIKTGEDIYFCNKVTDAGYEIYAHPEVRCGHYNPVEMEKMYRVLKKQIETKQAPKVKA